MSFFSFQRGIAMETLRTTTRTLFAGLLLLAAPLFAQLNSNSAWQKSKTDFLNLYQGSSTNSLAPEILLVLDKSGSTSRLMFHKLFPNNWKDEDQPNTPTGSVDYTIVIKNTAWPTSGPLTNTLTVGFGTNYSSTSPLGSISASGKNYYIGGSRGTVKINGITYPYNTLIKPDGTEVTAEDVATAGGNKSNAVDWMRCASHVRLRLTKIDSTSLTVPRDIDFPLFWAPIDAGATITSTARGLTRAMAHDPVGGTDIEFEKCYNTTNPDSNSTSNSSYVNIYGGTSNTLPVCSVRSRYIEWVFVGKDPNNGGAYYCIPNALPTDNSDKSVMKSIDPASIQYDGASDTYSWTYIDETATPPKNINVGWWTSFDNKLPNRTRMQAIKESVVKTWLNHQTSVMFAYRYLYDSGATPSNSITDSNDGKWNYITSVADLSSIASVTPSGGTPLVESCMNAYCQMTNPDAFKAQINAKGYTAAQLECQHHFVIVLTDGAPSKIPSGSEGSCSYPYAQTTVPSGCGYTASTCPAYSGNAAVKANNSLVTSTYWNVPSLAGIAAHGGDGSTASTTWIKDPLYETLTGAIENWLPFWVTKRTTGGTTVQTLVKAQPIQTMTVGVSLGVDFLKSDNTDWGSTNTAPTVRTAVKPIQNDKSGSKYRLLGAAYFGDPAVTSYDITTAGPFYLPTGSRIKPADAAYFFDGRDPQTLVNNLDEAFSQIVSLSGNNATAAPVFPTIGGGLGAEVYIAKFLPPLTSGPLWTGDLMMFPTKETATGTSLINKTTGNVLTGNLDKSLAVWSAEDSLINRIGGWTSRVIYTRLPATSGNSNPGLMRVNLGTNGNDTTNAGYSAISSLLPGANPAAKLKNWQYFVGADVGGSTTPLPTRSSTIMGDIIDSSPAVVEYTNLPLSIESANSTLYNAWEAHKPAATTGDKSGHFRMIFVGTNQGFLHAFGEVSWTDTTTNASVPITRGVVDELWAFAPTDIVPYIDQLAISTNTHHFAVDGAPTVYLLDRPQTDMQTAGNGKFDVSTDRPERAIVIFGLGKGGRSYYAINVADPAIPTMQWSLCPDEPNNYSDSSGRIKSGSATTIAKMGLSTCIPTIARVATARVNTAKPNLIVDAVMLGGGYSDNNIEGALPGTPAGPAKNTPLGRSVIAIEVSSGDILSIWDISSNASAGPVSVGVVPHEYAEGSGLNQRAYFTDNFGGLWALGSDTRQGSSGGYLQFRLDSSKIDDWVARNVYRQAVVSGGIGNGLISTLPVPFNLSYFPYVRTTVPKIAPGAVGVAFVTGDRNNPLDDMTYTSWTKPNQHRVNVLFDRQDINTTLTDSDLANAGDSSFTTDTTSDSYFLKTGYGYYINFPTRANSGTYVAKGIVSPLVLDGALFYSYFNPTSTSCAGGTGTSDTFRACNIMRPVANSTANWSNINAGNVTAVNGCTSGRILTWTGVASTLALRSILTGVQAGMTSSGGVINDTTQTQNLELQNLPTLGSSRFSKIRVWRTVH